MYKLISLGLVAMLSVACDKGSQTNETPTPSATQVPAAPAETTPTPATASAAPSAAPAAKQVSLTIAAVPGQMAFDTKTLTVPAGSEVHLTFKNPPPKGSPLSHNWALVKPGTEAKVAAAGLDKGPDAGYIAESDDLIAHTDMTAPGAESEVTFKAPPAGTYPYICTFPGHYVMMKGTLTVTP